MLVRPTGQDQKGEFEHGKEDGLWNTAQRKQSANACIDKGLARDSENAVMKKMQEVLKGRLRQMNIKHNGYTALPPSLPVASLNVYNGR